MPYDGLKVLQNSRAIEIGLVPVPKSVAEKHKADFERKFRRWHWFGINRSAIDGGARWANITLEGVSDDLEYWLKHPPIGMTNDRSGAPQALIDLALKVRATLINPVFEIEYFYTDPILNVIYEDGFDVRKDCLGIWDNGKIIAIAKLT